MDHKSMDYPRRFKVQTILENKPTHTIIPKSPKPNNILVNMVATVLTLNHIVLETQMFKECKPLKA
jgi:hypothetical protein